MRPTTSNANNNENIGSSWMGRVILVPTKNPDNEVRAASPTSITSTSLQDTSSCKRQCTRGVMNQRQQRTTGHDAFLHYSNDEVRINTLMMRRDEGSSGANHENETHQQQQPQQVDVERKTRISFELHPSLILEDMWDEDDDSIFGGEGIDIEELLLNMARARAT